MSFVKAERKQTKLRLCLQGISGSGKTYSSLLLATGLGGKIAVIDTERGSSSLYSDQFEFDVLNLSPPFTPDKYMKAVKDAEKLGYNILIIDSLSHAWAGEGGILDIHSAKVAGSAKGNSYMAWKDVTPQQNKLIETILQSRMHALVTMRSKAHYDIVKDEKGGNKPIKIGLAPIQRDGLEFEFDCVFELSQNNYANADKDRTGLFKGKDFIITGETGIEILKWLNSGKPNELLKLTTNDQLKNFNELIEICGISKETQEKWLNLYNVTKFENVTEEGMTKLINAMNKKVQELQESPI